MCNNQGTLSHNHWLWYFQTHVIVNTDLISWKLKNKHNKLSGREKFNFILIWIEFVQNTWMSWSQSFIRELKSISKKFSSWGKSRRRVFLRNFKELLFLGLGFLTELGTLFLQCVAWTHLFPPSCEVWNYMFRIEGCRSIQKLAKLWPKMKMDTILLTIRL